jgi:hypothetical protein
MVRRYSESLLLKNIAYSLTLNTLDFPSFFLDAGYSVAWIECTMKVGQESLSFDFAAISAARNKSAVVEIKGGAYSNSEEQGRFAQQLARYAKLTSADLVTRGFPVSPPQSPSRHQHQVCIMVPSWRVAGVEMFLHDQPFSPPILSIALETGSSEDIPLFMGVRTTGTPLYD